MIIWPADYMFVITNLQYHSNHTMLFDSNYNGLQLKAIATMTNEDIML